MNRRIRVASHDWHGAAIRSDDRAPVVWRGCKVDQSRPVAMSPAGIGAPSGEDREQEGNGHGQC